MDRFCAAIGFALSLVVSFGCSPAPQASGPPVGNVKGIVNVDGKSVPTGEIHFGMAGVPPKVLEIKDGAFTGEAPVGNNKVEVFIYVEGPSSEKYGGARSKKNSIPQKYWGANTTLSAVVTAGGANDFKFDITSK
ncbi:hypothetical protein [Zavarzinella formosa]|uniref:hypothetical protein n=1 Tax=Zavarzinella formosa TaxID=360055 RepID=UPI0004953EEE|nr:hypothetical protein [Zavarzinella formosa]